MSLVLLVIALLALAVGPALAGLGGRAELWRSGFEGFSIVLVACLCILMLIPHALEHGGLVAIVAGLAGAVIPIVLERLGGQLVLAAEVTGLVLLLVHAALDGAALAVFGGEGSLSGGAAVAVHRLPVGFAVAAMAARGRTRDGAFRVTWLTVGWLVVATVGGYVLGGPAVAGAPDVLQGAMEGAVAGFLLHIVFEPPRDQTPREARQRRPWAVIGAMIAIVVVSMLTLLGPERGEMALYQQTVDAWVDIAARLGPPLLLGYVGLGLLRTLPRHFRPWRGMPPVLTLEAALITAPLLGWWLTLARVLGAGLMVAVLTWVGGYWLTNRPRREPPKTQYTVPRFSDAVLAPLDRSVAWLVLGISIAAIAEPYVASGWFLTLPAPLHVPIFSLLGLAVPGGAAGITPVAAIAGAHGMSAGAVVALMIAAPAAQASAAGLLVTRGEGRVAAVRLGLTIVLAALVVGWSVDLLGLRVPPLSFEPTTPLDAIVGRICAMLLGFAGIASLARSGPRTLISWMTHPRRARAIARQQ